MSCEHSKNKMRYASEQHRIRDFPSNRATRAFSPRPVRLGSLDTRFLKAWGRAMRTRTAALYLLLILCVALLAAGVLHWLHILHAAAIGSIGLLAGYAAIYVFSRWRRD